MSQVYYIYELFSIGKLYNLKFYLGALKNLRNGTPENDIL